VTHLDSMRAHFQGSLRRHSSNVSLVHQGQRALRTQPIYTPLSLCRDLEICESRLWQAFASLDALEHPLDTDILYRVAADLLNLPVQLAARQTTASATRPRRGWSTQDHVRDLAPAQMCRHAPTVLSQELLELVIRDVRVRAAIDVDYHSSKQAWSVTAVGTVGSSFPVFGFASYHISVLSCQDVERA